MHTATALLADAPSGQATDGALTGGEATESDLMVALPDVTDELPCRAHDGELWFAERPEEVERAKALCADCPLQVQCLQGALSRREPWGVWGGQLFVQGAVVARKRPRGRPRKTTAA
ncbi:WhiB family redox-sensing transcriptional regulator [Kineosphaera limosa]|uniref:Transcriptional regulator WhiB n=2 Tax=Kineosphaera TaxID=211469 RepID=K6WD12_9MICO|nr:WhiB family redox-sensing transcriptional regulator [Kineosphaera limosa]GAB97170.1 putative WhiB family regulatory protein [Kineosphaera limosa NBRC 100340]